MTEYDRLSEKYEEAGKRLVEESRRCLALDVRELYPAATAAIAWVEDDNVFLHGLEGATPDTESADWETLMDKVTVYLDDVWMIELRADPTITEFTVQLP